MEKGILIMDDEPESLKRSPVHIRWQKSISFRLMASFIIPIILIGGFGGLVIYLQYQDGKEHSFREAEQTALMLSIAIRELDEKFGDEEIFFDRPEAVRELVDEFREIYKRGI